MFAPLGEHVARTDAHLRLGDEPHELVLLQVEGSVQRAELLLQRGAGGKQRCFPRVGQIALGNHLLRGFGNLLQPLVYAVVLIQKEVDFQVAQLVAHAQVGARGGALRFQRFQAVAQFL